MKIGLAVGKFYPPHVGHHHLIETAVAECDEVLVAVCYSSVENIDVWDRILWLADKHRTVRFFPVFDDSPVLYTEETWRYFLDALMNGLDVMGFAPNVIYSGEHYAEDFAQRLTKRFPGAHTIIARKVDRNAVVAFSATQFRADPGRHWDYLAPATRAGLCKRIVICGAESSGTTTLAKSLAEHYQTTVVPEYGRHFDWAVGKHHEWKHEDFLHIAETQKQWEDDLARESRNGLLICDTDEFATAMFHEVYLNAKAPEVIGLANESPADLYIVTDHEGVDFEDDGTRFNSGRREWMTQWMLDTLPGRVCVSGDHNKRMQQAQDYIAEVLHWHIEDPIEYRTVSL